MTWALADSRPFREIGGLLGATTSVSIYLPRNSLQPRLAPDDETWVADTTKHVAELDGRFDLVISWQVLEHVKPIEDAFENFWLYLRPGGRFICQLSGTFSCFGLANRILPHSLTVMLLHRLVQRDPATVFPAHYHHCWHNALRRALHSWNQVEILPRYIGAQYLGAIPPIQWLYLRYEGWALCTQQKDLATHYIIDAGR